MGDYIFAARLADWPKKYKIVGDVRGRGLMIGFEIVRDQRTKEKAADLRNHIVDSRLPQRIAASWAPAKTPCAYLRRS